MGRAQSIVCRDNRVLMVKHRDACTEWWCLPGGGVAHGESPADAALRELAEECNVSGTILRSTSEWRNSTDIHSTFLVDIGSQEPRLGHDPELGDQQILCEVKWLALDEIPERDRVYLWAAGLIGIEEFLKVVSSWGDAISFPSLRPNSN